MKQFIKELKAEWVPLKSFPIYKYSKANSKYFVRRIIILLNKEASGIALHLFNTPVSIAVIIFSVATASSLSVFTNNDTTVDLLNSITGFIISFISVLVAAAIFISTLHRQSSNKTADEDIKFQEVIMDNKGTLSKVYEICNSIASDEERIKLFKSTPCDRVTEYSDYEKYKRWHLENVGTLKNTKIETYDNYLRYPYNAAMSVTWNRAYFMADGCEVAIVLLDRAKNKNKDLKVAVKDLLVASKRNQTAGSRGYYVPTEFVGQRLYRVVIYSIFALLAIFSYTIFNRYEWDLIPAVNLHTPFVLLSVAISSTLISLYLILRYVFKFITYLKDSTSYYFNGYNSLYIHEPDLNMHDPGNSYGI